MAGQRPPRAAVRAAVRECLRDLEPGERVVVALSGGADSLALTAAVVAVGGELGLMCEAVVIDHQLQPGSGEVSARAAAQARILGCAEARVITVEVASGPGSGGTEAAARAARYAALDAAAGVPAGMGAGDGAAPPGDRAGVGTSVSGSGTARDKAGTPQDLFGVGATISGDGPARDEAADERLRGVAGDESGDGLPTSPPAAAILLGHTREDQAETVLLGLARGSGTRSLAGMAPVAGVYRRPLLDVPRAVVVAAALAAAAEDRRLEPWSDPHNVDGAFARVRVRNTVLPVLEAELGPGIVDALSRTATLAREDADALDAWADHVWAQVRDRTESPSRTRPPAPQQLGNVLPQDQQEPSELAVRPVGSLSVCDLNSPSHGHPDGPLPPAIVNRVVRRFLIEAGCPTGSLTAGHIHAVAGLLDPSASRRAVVALPGGRRARREAGALVVRV